MAYQICILKSAPCCVIPWTVGCTVTGAACVRVLDIFGSSPDLSQGEHGTCTQGTYLSTGCCCAWTVPAGVTSITVELWGGGGGGGSGANAQCLGQNPGGGAASYVKRNSLAVTPGDVMTFCAGAGGCGGPNYEGSDPSYCCCGAPGTCSYVKRNGTFCADSQGGPMGPSCCYLNCGCFYTTTGGNLFEISGGPCGANGSWAGCTGYTAELIGSPTAAPVFGCTGQGMPQAASSAGTTFGGEQTFSAYMCNCWSYLRFNTSCANTAGISGPGGDTGAAAVAAGTSAFNTPGTSGYACSTSSFTSCSRTMPGLPGNFPGGGGSGGVVTSCCCSKSPGGVGAPGYIRVYY